MSMDFFSRLVSYETHLWNRLDRALRDSGNESMANLMALRTLDRHGGQGRVHELSDELDLTMGAASKLADRLERAGFAQRRPHPADRRSSLISLTAAGQRALADGLRALQPVLGELLPDRREVEAAEKSLVQLQARLDSANGPTGGGRR